SSHAFPVDHMTETSRHRAVFQTSHYLIINTMKRLLLLILICIPCTIIMAQDQRTLSTRVADLLLKLPAEDADQLKIYMQEIGEMGENGLVAMVEMLSAPGEADNSQLEYAIGGFTFYASQ